MLRRLFLASTALAMTGAAFAADMPSRAGAPIPYAPPMMTWTGFYVGGSLGSGYASGSADYSAPLNYDTDYGNAPGTTSKLLGVAGVQAGYNWQIGSFDYNFAFGGRGKTLSGWPDSGSQSASISQQVRSTASFRTRVGVDFAGTLVYGTFGIGAVNVRNNMNVVSINNPANSKGGEFKANKWKPAFVVGGGIERMITQNWSIRGEVLHYMIENSTGNASDFSYFGTDVPGVKYENKMTVGRVGLNYHF
jgi:outer membrane immunogenic protein